MWRLLTLVLVAVAISQASGSKLRTRTLLQKLRTRGRTLEERRPRERTATTSSTSTSDLCARRESARGACFDADNNFLATACNESVVAAWLATYSAEAQQLAARVELAAWNYDSNITDETAAQLEAVETEASLWENEKFIEAIRFPASRYSNKSLTRMLRSLQYSKALCDEADISEYTKLKARALSLYGSTSACVTGVGCLTGETQFDTQMQKHSDYDTLLRIWTAWHDAAGPPQRALFERRVELLNKGATENGWPDAGFYDWFTEYEVDRFDQVVTRYWQALRPLYRKLHAYVRYKLRAYYPGRFGARDPIPVHLLGGLWGQLWNPIIKRVKPYVNISDTDITDTLTSRGYTAKSFFKMADEFYESVDLFAMTSAFWKYSIIERPTDGRSIDCHGAAHDMILDDDYRILMCTEITTSDFYVVHHEMGHVEYFMAYRQAQPYLFRDGANAAFHEAVGDSIALSVLTPEHLYTIGLLDSVPSSTEFDINFLLGQALEKVAFLHWGYMLDAWRWRTLNGTIEPAAYNHWWWKMRVEIGGIMPPVDRPESSCFDPGAKYHVATGVGYIRYFLSFIFQFQIYRTMCSAAGYTGSVHRCDIYKNTAAGETLKNMLELGSSVRWQDAIAELTDGEENDFNPDALLEYFEPLSLWLDEFIEEYDVPVGWKTDNLPVSF